MLRNPVWLLCERCWLIHTEIQRFFSDKNVGGLQKRHHSSIAVKMISTPPRTEEDKTSFPGPHSERDISESHESPLSGGDALPEARQNSSPSPTLNTDLEKNHLSTADNSTLHDSESESFKIPSALRAQKTPESHTTIGWDVPKDPDNPRNWSNKKRWKVTSVVSLFTFIRSVCIVFHVEQL